IYICFRNNTQPFGSNPGGPGNGGNELVIDNIRVTDNSEPVSATDTEVFQNLTVRPNPAASGADVAVLFSMERPEQVFVDVTDITGKVISVENRGVLSSGNHMINLDRNGLATGIYLVRLRTESASQVVKVVFE
ncbi:MAG: T9SS type A sorting domain-containing protein, partial [Flavobacteriales bacterium]|nr:T9SS type A sorting domain-containing protein [Flavobacteriales bacterium]